MLPSRKLNALALSWLVGGLTLASCGGEAFTGSEARGDAGKSAEAGTSFAGADAGGGGTAAGASAGGAGGNFDPSPDAGDTSNGDAGAGGVAGGSGSLECDAAKGKAFGGHCYIDATVHSVTQAQAVAACQTMSATTKLSAHLLVLDSIAEQKFILETFLRAFEDKSDAWLGLTCDSLRHPEITDCYCTDCKTELASKQKAWAWLDGATSTFGWINGNPNGAFRCAALAWNPDLTLWGWVDRACDQISVAPIAGHLHDYRTLCELEP